MESGPRQGVIAEIGSDTVLIGRGATCHIRLDDDQVSREHAMVTRRGRRLVLRDLQSRNGTQMDGHFVKERRLRPGEVFSVGQTQIRYTDYITPEDRTLFAEAAVDERPGRPKSSRPIQVVYDSCETSKFTYLCFVCCLAGINWVLAAAALAAGVTSIVHIRRRGDLGGIRLAWVASAIALVICVGHAHRRLWVPVTNYWQGVEAHHQCRRNMRTLHGAMLRYTIANASRYPQDLGELLKGYLSDPSCLMCPLAAQPDLLTDGTPVSYAYFGHGASLADSNAVLLLDHRAQNHAERGRMVLFGDGRIEFIAEADAFRLMRMARARAVPRTINHAGQEKADSATTPDG